MPADLSTVHANKALASMSVWLESEDNTFLLPRVCGRRKVKNLSDIYFQHGREQAKKASSAGASDRRFLPSLTGPGAEAPVTTRTVAQKTYVGHRYAYKELVTDTEIQKSDDPLTPLKDAGKVLRKRVMNDAEFIFSKVCAAYSIYNSSYRTQLTTGANGTSWNKASAAGTGSEPLTDIRVGKIALEKNIQEKANTLVLSAVSRYHLDDHDDLKAILQYTKDDYLEGEGIPEHLRGLRLVTGYACADTAADGGTFADDYLFGDQEEATAANQPCAIICYRPPGMEVGVREFASFFWFDIADETTGQHGISITTWRDNGRRGYWVEAAQTLDIRPGLVDGSSNITGAYMISRAAIP